MDNNSIYNSNSTPTKNSPIGTFNDLIPVDIQESIKEEVKQSANPFNDIPTSIYDNTKGKAYSELTKDKEKEAQTAKVLEEKGIKLAIKPSKEAVKEGMTEPMEIPARFLYLQRKKAQVPSNRVWLCAHFDCMTREELMLFHKRYRNSLSIGEESILTLYYNALSGNIQAQNEIWNIHKMIFQTMKSVYVENMRQEQRSQAQKTNDRLADTLEKIGERLLAQEQKMNQNFPQEAQNDTQNPA